MVNFQGIYLKTLNLLKINRIFLLHATPGSQLLITEAKFLGNIPLVNYTIPMKIKYKKNKHCKFFIIKKHCA
jgi:hypothetical protein